MRFYTEQECQQWLSDRSRRKPNEMPELVKVTLGYPSQAYRWFAVARWIAMSLTHNEPTLLWITEWGVWRSSENWHLYYKLRQSCQDYRLLEDAPGHFFLPHETADLVSFLQLAMLNGWGGYVLTQADYVNAFFSHDEFFDFYAEREENLAAVRDRLDSGDGPH